MVNNNVIDAEWYPSKKWAKDPEKYSAHCARVRDCKLTARVQRLFLGACVLLVVVVAVALAVQ